MPNDTSFPHSLHDAGVARLRLGRSRHPGTGHAKRRGEIWIVLHTGDGAWTGIYRLDERDGRTVHLERALDGHRWSEGVRWAVETFRLRPASAAGSTFPPGAAPDEAERKPVIAPPPASETASLLLKNEAA